MTDRIRHTTTLLAFLCAFVINSCWADQIVGRVVAVADGDTLTVLTADKEQHRIRLSGIDAPEQSQAFGSVSKRHLSDLAFNKEVVVEYDKRDRYGRIVGKVFAAGQDVCLGQLEAGLAWHYKKYEREQPAEDRPIYARSEVAAREARRGLWQDTNPVPPWEFRHAKRR